MTALRTAAAVAALLLLTAACAPGSGDPVGGQSPTGGAAPAAATVTVTRSGGIAGVRDEVIVDPLGAWTATGKSGTHKTGDLTAEQQAQLQALAADPKLAEEAKQARKPTKCRDAFNYTVAVTAGQVQRQVAYTDCPSDENMPETAAAIAGLVMGAAGS